MDLSKQIAKCIIDSSNKFGIRSPKRSDPIHKLIADIITIINPELSCRIEEKLKISSGSFKVDISVRHGSKMVCLISFKAPLNNIKQNMTNGQNVKGGELLKMINAYPDAKIIFMDFIPVQCCYYYKDGRMKNTETFVPEKVIKSNSDLIKILTPRGVSLCDGIFTVFTNNIYPELRGQLEFVEVVNHSDMDRFVEFIRQL
jgi:hypothetical protein